MGGLDGYEWRGGLGNGGGCNEADGDLGGRGGEGETGGVDLDEVLGLDCD